jgi:hypothetical protein
VPGGEGSRPPDGADRDALMMTLAMNGLATELGKMMPKGMDKEQR